jgi:threonyl-tRNA synthetase
VQVLGVRADHDGFAAQVVERLKAQGFRAEMVEADNPLGSRIRKGKLEKLPYILVVGDTDVENDTAGVNPRGGEVERDVPIAEFIERVATEIEGRETSPRVR